jgi:PAS domain S-box-containing protein
MNDPKRDDGPKDDRDSGVNERPEERTREREELEARFRRMGDLIPFGFWSADTQGAMQYVGDSLLEMTGAAPDEMRGDGWTKFLHGADRERTLASFRRAVAAQSFWDHEHRVRGKDGEYYAILSRGVPLRDEAGNVVSWAGINLDVTERKRFVSELKSAKEVAEAASRSKDEFLTIVSHELRTPLTPVMTAVQMLEDESSLSEEGRSSLEIIRRNVELEARLIDDLLDLTRVFRGKLPLAKEPVDVHKVLQNVLDICRPDVMSKGLRLRLSFEASAPRTFADPARLQQVFWNLVKNAVKFTPTGGEVGLKTETEEDGRIAISVSDTGIGIAPEELPKLFDAFEQGSDAVRRAFGGLGLGLSISRALVEMLGGTIDVRSEGKGKGATFRVHLSPYAGSTAPSRPAPQEGRKIRVLLVDDHRDTCILMKSMLLRRGFEVTTADSVASALEAADGFAFDVLLSDLGLPDGSGHDLIRKLAAKAGARIPGIALTGFGREEDRRQSRLAGFAEHFTKPINFTKLEAALRRLYEDRVANGSGSGGGGGDSVAPGATSAD